MAETASIKVDFNSVTEHGRVKASTRRADGPVAEGDHVIAYDPYERLAYPAVVVAINEATGGLLLDVAWDELIPHGAPASGIVIVPPVRITITNCRFAPEE